MSNGNAGGGGGPPNNVIPFPAGGGQGQGAQAAGAGPAAPAGNNNLAAALSSPMPPPGPITAVNPKWPAQQVWDIRYRREFNADQKQRIIYNFICRYENSKATRMGSAFIRLEGSNKPYLFEGRTARLLHIDHNNTEFTGYLWNTYGLWSGEPLTKRLISALRDAAVATGLPRAARRFTYWDSYDRTLYISGFDGSCYQITGKPLSQGGVTIVPNGTGPAIFLDDDRGTTPAEPMIGNNRALFTHLIDDLQYVPSTSGGMSPEIQKTCLAIWILAIAFPDLLPTKPIMLFEGARGSGKTAAAQRIALALHGKFMPIQIPKQEDKDFGVKILRSPIAILDDVNEPVDWLRDTLCTYATGGGWTKRALYSDDAEHIIKPESFLAVTTNNPTTFRQGQVADRCLILRLERREEKAGYVGANSLFDAIRDNRDEIFGEWLMWLNEIVAELRRNPAPTPTKSRMADFAHLAHIIGRVLSRPHGPAGRWSHSDIEEMLAAMQDERNALIIDEDPLVDLLDKWLESPSNVGRDVKMAELHAELVALAKAVGATTFRSPKALAARIREAGSALEKHFEITRHAGHGGVLIYSFRPV